MKSKPSRVRVESLKDAVPVLVRLPRAMHEGLMREKARTGKTLNVIVRSAVESWLKRGGRQ